MTMKGATPSPRYHHSAVVYEGDMFVFGGYTGYVRRPFCADTAGEFSRMACIARRLFKITFSL